MINQTIETIKKRFSCRKFSDKSVEDEKLHQIIEAAKYAPNGKNMQAWHFTIIRTEKGKNLLRKAAGTTPPPGFPQGKRISPPGMPEMVMTWPFQGDFCGAPVVIIISGREDVPWADINPVLAAENLMIAATSVGLASLWSTVFTSELFRDEESRAVRSLLLPKSYEVKATLFIGYPESEPVTRPPRKENNETWI